MRRLPLALLVALTACPAWWDEQEPELSTDSSLPPQSNDDSSPTFAGSESTASPTSDGPGTTLAPDSTSAAATTTSAAATSTTAVTATTSAAADLPSQAMDDAWCDDLDPTQVYLVGTYQQGTSLPAVFRPDHPRAGCAGFGSLGYGGRNYHIRPTDHKLLYVDEYYPNAVHAFSRDPQVWSGGWQYPGDPAANDETVIDSPCQEPAGVWELLVHPGNGSIVFRCNDNNKSYRDETNKVVFTPDPADTLLAVGHDDTYLTTGYFKEAGELLLHPPGDAPVPVIPPPGASMTPIVHARALAPSGFWIVALPDGGAPERWHVAPNGSVVEQLTFSLPPMQTLPNADSFRCILTATGDLVFPRPHDGNFDDYDVVRCPLEPGEPNVLYTTFGVAEQSWPDDPEPFVYLSIFDVINGGVFTAP